MYALYEKDFLKFSKNYKTELRNTLSLWKISVAQRKISILMNQSSWVLTEVDLMWFFATLHLLLVFLVQHILGTMLVLWQWFWGKIISLRGKQLWHYSFSFSYTVRWLAGTLYSTTAVCQLTGLMAYKSPVFLWTMWFPIWKSFSAIVP